MVECKNRNNYDVCVIFSRVLQTNYPKVFNRKKLTPHEIKSMKKFTRHMLLTLGLYPMF
jgi:hypothetical protein